MYDFLGFQDSRYCTEIEPAQFVTYDLVKFSLEEHLQLYCDRVRATDGKNLLWIANETCGLKTVMPKFTD